MDKKVHLSEMDRPYVGIRKNHTEEIKMDKKVHLAEMDFISNDRLAQESIIL